MRQYVSHCIAVLFALKAMADKLFRLDYLVRVMAMCHVCGEVLRDGGTCASGTDAVGFFSSSIDQQATNTVITVFPGNQEASSVVRRRMYNQRWGAPIGRLVPMSKVCRDVRPGTARALMPVVRSRLRRVLHPPVQACSEGLACLCGESAPAGGYVLRARWHHTRRVVTSTIHVIARVPPVVQAFPAWSVPEHRD